MCKHGRRRDDIELVGQIVALGDTPLLLRPTLTSDCNSEYKACRGEGEVEQCGISIHILTRKVGGTILRLKQENQVSFR